MNPNNQIATGDTTTDTHLAKKYNDALYSCINACNSTGMTARANSHISTILAYHSAVYTFYMNTFFLFENTRRRDEKRSISEQLRDTMLEVDVLIDKMVNNVKMQTDKSCIELRRLISDAHMMIMYGLQQRNMLVRISEREPRGIESVKYWGNKKSFSKGGFNPERKIIK
jgi:hypothetical protein